MKKFENIESTKLISSDQYNLLRNSLRKLFQNKKINKILLINPPDGDQDIFNFEVAKTKRYTNFAPYGLGIISKHLNFKHYETNLLNLNDIILKKVHSSHNKDEFDYKKIINDEIKNAIDSFKPDLIGLTCMFSMTHKSLKYVSEVIKKNSNCPVAAGGVHISNSICSEDMREGFLSDLKDIDLFFLFEAELAFSEFLDLSNQNFDNIELLKQVFIRGEELNFLVKERLRPEGDTLNVIPDHSEMGSMSLSESGKVGNFGWLKEKNQNITTILSNRGCRAQCTFCSVRSFNGVKVRQRSVQSAIDELLYLRDKQNISHVMWLDDDLLYNTKRTMELFNEMVKQDVGVTWDASNGVIAASVTDEIMSAARDSGCIGLVIGMESGNPEILKSIKKPGTVKNFIKAADVLKNYPEINSRVFLMIGFPEETFAKVLDTINVAREMNMDWNYITPLQPLPNTPIFDKMVDDNLAGTEGFGDIKYFVGGGYAKIGSGKSNPLQDSFETIFKKTNLDKIPNPDETKIIWAFMNYYLNFDPLKNITNKHKIEQNVKWMRYVSDIVAKNDPIALYYKMVLEKKYSKSKQVNESDMKRIDKIFNADPQWLEKTKSLGLLFDKI